MERWVPAKGFPNYDISSEGRVRNRKTGRILKANRSSKKYLSVTLCRNNCQYTVRIHRLVYDSFMGVPDGFDVMFRDGDRANVRLDNLKVVTRKENIHHAMETGQFKPNDYGKKRIKVRVIETGKVYDSIRECARDIGCGSSDISNHLLGYHRPVKGYTFEKV